MKHTIRIKGDIKTVDCELGSGVFDKHGKEIFEGDIIKNPSYDPADVMDTPNFIVVYDEELAAFVFRDPVLHKNNCEPFPNELLTDLDGEFEVIDD